MRKVIFLLMLFSFTCFVTSCSKHEEVACELVTSLLNDNFGKAFKAMNMETAKCKAVELGDPVRNGYYHNAKAYLDNGKTLRITVEVKWDSVYVQIPNESIFGE